MYDVVSVELIRDENSFEILTNFPQKIYSQKNATLDESEISNQMALFVRDK